MYVCVESYRCVRMPTVGRSCAAHSTTAPASATTASTPRRVAVISGQPECSRSFTPFFQTHARMFRVLKLSEKERMGSKERVKGKWVGKNMWRHTRHAAQRTDTQAGTTATSVRAHEQKQSSKPAPCVQQRWCACERVCDPAPLWVWCGTPCGRRHTRTA